MKVIIVEVTRAANSFGAAHIGKIAEAYRLIAAIVEKAQASGEFRTRRSRRSSPRWRSTARSSRCSPAGSSGCSTRARTRYERAKDHIVETICRGLDARTTPRAMTDNDMVKRLAWSGLLAGMGALASIVTTRLAAVIYRRVFGEDPPE